MPPLDWISANLQNCGADLDRRLRILAGAQTAEILLDGRRVLNFGSNDYLGLAADHVWRRPPSAAVRREGWGSGASPLVTG